MIFLILFAVVAPVAPTSSAVVVPPSVAASEYQVGKMTISDLIAKLGKPNSTEVNSDGTTTIRYMSVRTRVKGASFIPVVGLFAGGAKSKTTTKSFTFGADSLLKSYSSGDFQAQCNTFGGCH